MKQKERKWYEGTKEIIIPTVKAFVSKEGTFVKDYCDKFENAKKVLAMKVNGRQVNLNDELHVDGNVTLSAVNEDSVEGESILRRTLVFLMGLALHEMGVRKQWHTGFQLDNAYYCGRFCVCSVSNHYLFHRI